MSKKGGVVSVPPRYLCRGGPLDGLLINEGYTEHPAPTVSVAGGLYRIDVDAQGPGLHMYRWEG